MAENKQKSSGPTRKQALAISGSILFLAVLIAGFLVWRAQKQGAGTGNEAKSLQIELRESSVLTAPDPYEASREEIEEYERLLERNTVRTDTIYVEDGCFTDPMVADITIPNELRIVNNSAENHTLSFTFKDYSISAGDTEFVNILNDGMEGKHYYFCDNTLTGIIILEAK